VNLRVRLQDKWRNLLRALGFHPYLCRTCMYNNPRDCRHRSRPCAMICEDYRRK